MDANRSIHHDGQLPARSAVATEERSIALSLRWCVHDSGSLEEALGRVVDAGFSAVEVCGLTSGQAERWQECASARGLVTTGVHAPVPDEVRGGRRYPGDWLLSDDPDLRHAARTAAKRTIRFARAIGVPYAVFHLGGLELAGLHHRLCAVVAEEGVMTSAYRAVRNEYREARDRVARRRRRHLMVAVEELLKVADGRVQVCVENRYRYDQVPNLSDIFLLRSRFPDADHLRYWHDTGHEWAQRHLGVWDDLLYAYAVQDLAGLHVHDCVGTDDHRPPGDGDYPFERLRTLVRPGIPLVLEPTPRASAEALTAGGRMLLQRLSEA